MSNATFHFKQGASGDDHSVSHDLKLSTAWVVTHPLQEVTGTHPPTRGTAGRPACLLKLEGKSGCPRLGKVPGCVEAGGLASSPPEMLASSESPGYTKVVLLACVASPEDLLCGRHSDSLLEIPPAAAQLPV